MGDKEGEFASKPLAADPELVEDTCAELIGQVDLRCGVVGGLVDGQSAVRMSMELVGVLMPLLIRNLYMQESSSCRAMATFSKPCLVRSASGDFP